MPGLAIGSRIRKSPFYAATVAAGANEFTVYNHMYMPTSYGDPDAEYCRLTETVALWDVAVQRPVEINGADAASLTQYLSARDLTHCGPGRAAYAPLCDHDGRLINDPVILCIVRDRYWLSIADSDILLWARAVAGERGANVTICEPDVSPLAIQGPNAHALACDLFGVEVVDSLGFFEHASVSLDGIPVILCRSGWSKQGGFELFLTDGSHGTALWDLVMATGAAHDIGPGAPNQAERIESGLLSYRSDTDPETDPIEAGLGRFVSLDAPHDFVGKDALIARAAAQHARSRLVNVRVDGHISPYEHPRPALKAGSPVGALRNVVWSPRLAQPIGLALVTATASAPGTS